MLGRGERGRGGAEHSRQIGSPSSFSEAFSFSELTEFKKKSELKIQTTLGIGNNPKFHLDDLIPKGRTGPRGVRGTQWLSGYPGPQSRGAPYLFDVLQGFRCNGEVHGTRGQLPLLRLKQEAKSTSAA